MTTVRTRFAPSPTGTPESIHLGFVIRALWNYAYAKKNNGQFILRIEDTDQKRSRKDTEEEIFNTLKKFNIIWNEGPDVGGPFAPYRQSERLKKYQEVAHKLVEGGFAYYDFDAVIRKEEEIESSYETEEKLEALKVKPKARGMDPKEAASRVSEGESYVVRVKIPENRSFKYKDWILKKEIEFNSSDIPDMILLKSDGFPTYHLAVVVDDIDMKISHVFRGQEWISSTPIHLFLYEALSQAIPQIGHFSVILDPRTGKKFSKRDITSAFGVKTWLDRGYFPEAILNYLMLLGWAPKDDEEIFSIEEFIAAFDQDGVQKANPIFDEKKLDWISGEYIRQTPDIKLTEAIFEFFKGKYTLEKIGELIPLIKTRIKTLKEFETLAGFFFKEPKVDISYFGKDYKKHLKGAFDILGGINKWEKENIDKELLGLIDKSGFNTGDFFMTMRIAMTATRFTPPINESMVILGKEETLKRLKKLL